MRNIGTARTLDEYGSELRQAVLADWTFPPPSVPRWFGRGDRPGAGVGAANHVGRARRVHLPHLDPRQQALGSLSAPPHRHRDRDLPEVRHDLQGKGANGIRNSRTGSVYILSLIHI